MPPAVPPGQGVRLIACPRPFSTARIDKTVPAGWSVAQILAEAQPDPILRHHAHIFVGDRHVAPDDYCAVVPADGETVTIRVVPGKGGGGGGGGKNPLRTVLTIAVIAVSLMYGPELGMMLNLPSTPLFTIGQFAPSIASIVGGGIISVVGNLVVNAIAPPPSPKAPTTSLGGLGDYGASAQAYSIVGAQNRADPWGVVPRVHGLTRAYPKKAAREYTEVQGSDQYLRFLFDFGYGPNQVSAMRIGTVPIEQFEGVELEVREGHDDDQPITLYTNTIREDAYSLKVTQAGGRQIVETRDGAEEILVDASFNGLVYFNDAGNRQDRSVTLRIEWRKVGEVDWRLHAEETITAATESAVRKGWRIVTGAAGRYQVGITRTTADNTSTRARDDCYLTAVRTVQYTRPVKAKGRTLVAGRIKATDQLNGVINEFSAMVQAMRPVWTGTAWEVQATRHPAWSFADAFCGPQVDERFRADLSRLDAEALKEWADADPGRTFDHVVDTDQTVFELVRDICASSRAAFAMRDGKYGVVRDVAGGGKSQTFTPRNSWGFKGHKAFKPEIHGFRCNYVEPALDNKPHEVIAYADGYDETNASRFETLEMIGCTSREWAWKDGRYHLAVAELRPETYVLFTDIEYLVCTRGDIVEVQHDVPGWGIATGRVSWLIYDTIADQTRVVGVHLDERVVMEAGKNYVLRIRSAAPDESFAHSLEVEPGETATLMFQSPAPLDREPEIDDLAVFGEAEREVARHKVKAIHPGPNLSAQLVLVDEAPAVHEADQGPIPAWDPLITRQPAWAPQPPKKPVIEEVVSDERAMVRTAGGSLQARILVRIAPASGHDVPVFLEAQVRRSGAGEDWQPRPTLPGTATEVDCGPVEQGSPYDVRVMGIGRTGLASDWSMVTDHVVVGKSSPPPDPDGLYVEALPDGRVRYRVTGAQAIDSVGWLFRRRPGVDLRWGGATAVHAGICTADTLETSAFAGGTNTVLVKAVDVDGNESAGFAYAIVRQGERIADNWIDGRDYGAEGWPGTITSGAIEAGEVRAVTSTALFTDPSEPLFTDPSEPLFSGYDALDYETSLTPVHKGYLTLDHDTTGAATVEYCVTGLEPLFTNPNQPLFTDPSEPLFGAGSWISYAGPFLVEPGAVYGIRVSLPGGATRPVIHGLAANIEVETAEEILNDVALPSDGARLTPTRAWREILTVEFTAQQAPGVTAIRVEPLDKDPAGPLCRGFDAANLPAAALIDATIKGIPLL